MRRAIAVCCLLLLACATNPVTGREEIVLMAAEQSFSGFVAPFERSAMSFRALTSEERAGVRERRLAVVPARAGESLGALAERTGNVWRLEQVALVNGAEPAAMLEAGQQLKIVVERPYAAPKE